MELPFDVSGLRRDEIDALIALIAQLEQMGMPNPAQVAMELLTNLAQQAMEANEAAKTSGGIGVGNPSGEVDTSFPPAQATGFTG